MSAISAIRAKASTEYPEYPLDFEDGNPPFILKSIMDLDDQELKLFNESSKRLAKVDESEDLVELREEFISILAGVSNDKKGVSEKLGRESLGVLIIIFKEYAGSLSDGSKSPTDS